MRLEIADQQIQVHAIPNQHTHTHLEKQFNHPKIAKLQKGTFAK